MSRWGRTPTYSFCEPSTATGMRWHIRLLDDSGPWPNGGIPGECPALCGLDLQKGWDVNAPVDTAVVRLLLARNEEAGPVGQSVCVRCANIYNGDGA